MSDILKRLKATTKINDAYPRDIEDAIKEIEKLQDLLDYLDDIIPNLGDVIDTYQGGK